MMPRRHNVPKGASTMPHEDLEGVLSAIQAIEKFAGRLPEAMSKDMYDARRTN